jgi:adenine phosphoribosyltransferase
LDIFPILRDPAAFEVLITNFLDHLTSHTIPSLEGGKIDVVVGLDARGFLLGPIIASRLKAAFVPVRKIGKLPGECVDAEYQKEYGKVMSSSKYSTYMTVISVLIRYLFLGCISDASWNDPTWSERHSH